MKLGMIGLGRMGSNMALRLLSGDHRVVVYDISRDAVSALVKKGAIGADSIDEIVNLLPRPRAIWLMVPTGEATETTINTLAEKLAPGDFVVDGGNSFYRDSMRRALALLHRKILFLDVGTSGGIWGLKEGYCLMVGGEIQAFHHLEPAFKTLAPSPDKGYGHVGPSGAGHFVKMVHNGIEYGMMESLAEGFELMQTKAELKLDLHQIAQTWRSGSVIRSWLLDLTAAALKEDPRLENIEAYVEDSGEGRWTVQESLELKVPIPVITQSLQARFRSRQTRPLAPRLVAALRRQFGGHAVKLAKKAE